jgi:hypothetical protein
VVDGVVDEAAGGLDVFEEEESPDDEPLSLFADVSGLSLFSDLSAFSDFSDFSAFSAFSAFPSAAFADP